LELFLSATKEAEAAAGTIKGFLGLCVEWLAE
jgi:hypothetical protein